MARELASPKPEMLKWARTASGFDPDRAAKKLNMFSPFCSVEFNCGQFQLNESDERRLATATKSIRKRR
jgi:hypothetical protein